MSVAIHSDIPTFFTACLADLEKNVEFLTDTEACYAIQTIIAFSILFQAKETICQIKDENLRNIKITELTHLIAEPGLIPGNTEQEIKNAILSRINLLKTTFFYHLERKETHLLYRMGFIGPPCFNGRVITLEHYILQRHGIKSDYFYEWTSPIDDIAARLEETMYACIKHLNLAEEVPPTLNQLKTFAKENTEFFTNFSFSMDADNIQAVYKRACEFFRGY